MSVTFAGCTWQGDVVDVPEPEWVDLRNYTSWMHVYTLHNDKQRMKAWWYCNGVGVRRENGVDVVVIEMRNETAQQCFTRTRQYR